MPGGGDLLVCFAFATPTMVLSFSVEAQRRAVVVAVLLDLFGVSLVVPLLPVRFAELGVSQKANGMISSIYSFSQIVGGIGLGFLSDRGALGRRGLLLLSFAGAAMSYSMVGIESASLNTLLASRVVVGSLKQTMTASTSLLAELTEPGKERQLWIGRLSSAAQVSWIVGQSLGGVFYANSDPSLPAAAAVTAYVIAFALIFTILPASVPSSKRLESGPRESFWQKSKALAANFDVASVASARLLAQFLTIAANNGRALYELDRWQLTRADVSYLNSFKSGVSVLASWRADLFSSLSFWTIMTTSTALIALASLLEALPGTTYRSVFFFFREKKDLFLREEDCLMSLLQRTLCDPSLFVYAALLFPLCTGARQVSTIALRARFTEVVPRDQTASALATADVLSSAVSVLSPLATGFLFHQLSAKNQPLVVAALHGLGTIILVAIASLHHHRQQNAFSSAEDNNTTPPPRHDDKKKKLS